MQRLLHLTAIGLLFGGIQSGTFTTITMAALAAYVLIEAAESMPN